VVPDTEMIECMRRALVALRRLEEQQAGRANDSEPADVPLATLD
jgi:hypothetical protein